jgi:hypothetical protein
LSGRRKKKKEEEKGNDHRRQSNHHTSSRATPRGRGHDDTSKNTTEGHVWEPEDITHAT